MKKANAGSRLGQGKTKTPKAGMVPRALRIVGDHFSHARIRLSIIPAAELS